LRTINEEFLKNNIEATGDILKAVNSILYATEGQRGSLLPDTVDDYLRLLETPPTQSMTKLLAESTVQKHSVEWIKANGVCLDSIRPGKSNILGAGRGAFAQGFIREGDIVSPVLLINVVDRTLFNIYGGILDDDTGKVEEGVIGQQLLLNYCFGHTGSQLLFCPQTNSILLNHCSKRQSSQCGNGGPNAKVQWAHWDDTSAEWLGMSLDDVIEKIVAGSRGLTMEIVATRDILSGEEVIIDYGENWERAWEAHVQSWEAPINDGTYVPVRAMIESNDLRTADELESNPYPDNVQLVCLFWESEFEGDEEENDEGSEEETTSGEHWVSASEKGIDAESHTAPCEIVESYKRHDPEGRYEGRWYHTVRIFGSMNRTLLLKDYPEESISFRMKEYTSDMHLPNAFCHFIESDDIIFPDPWKNLSDTY